MRHSSPTSTRSGLCRSPKPKVNWLTRRQGCQRSSGIARGSGEVRQRDRLVDSSRTSHARGNRIARASGDGPRNDCRRNRGHRIASASQTHQPEGRRRRRIVSRWWRYRYHRTIRVVALLGSGDERNATVADRNVSQATGVSGSQLPAEFRGGLDAYFGALEASRSSTNSFPLHTLGHDT